MASSPPTRLLPVLTSGTVLIHVDFLLAGIVMTFLGPMLPILSARWSLNDARSGALIFAQFFGSMLGLFASGILVERRGYRLTLMIGSLLMATGMALLASGPWLAGIGSVSILGIGHGITTPAGNLRTAENKPRRSAAALNVLNSMWGLGAMSCPFLVAMAQRAHLVSLFLYGTALALSILFLTFLLTQFVSDTHAAAAAPDPVGGFWRIPALAPICFLFFIYVGTETSLGGWLATYAQRIESASHSLATMTPSFFWGSVLLGRAIAPLALKFARERTVAKAGLGVALLGGFALLAARGIILVVVGAVVAGLGLASIFPISVSLFAGWFGDFARRASGPVFASGTMGAAIVPWLVGAVSTRSSSLRLAFLIPLAGLAAMLAFYVMENVSREQLEKA